ncbi:polysaccharide deacetylase family protein [Kibdelosporangium phytohabitans]|uniref:polysaccharide deacetylase family protein n=1 Tax=Kibdelosporangium phytohabitans TaxID=860235 RepID=UPI0009F92C20|nr:polysaccharide deacetylase family protein [Kibdelosporangium phytohabitans]MBE1468810.1 hypothetical protein [Kibdelosporangium phytohabitans]
MTEPWQWHEDTWRGHVERVRAGRPLRPEAWPGGAKAAVTLSFDSDHETIPLRDGEVLPGKLSQGEYGARVGVPRVLRLLARFQAPSTYFMPAVSALLHEGEAKSYVDAGHEVALHGWIHERNTQLPPQAERDLAFRAGTSVEYTALPSIYREFRHDPDLAPLFEKHAKAIGRTFPDYPDKMSGSTDMGNVSLRIPAIHPMLSFDLPPEDGNHTAAFDVVAGGPDGDRFVHDAGLAMARTVAEVAQSGDLRARLITKATDR